MCVSTVWVSASEEQFQTDERILSFDIECDSSHGDFPVAKKDCKKLAIELFDQIDQSDIDGLDELDDEEKKKFFNYVDKNYSAKNEKD